MPSADLTLKIFLILTTILVFGLGSTSEARSIKSWPGFVQGWGGSCGSQFQNCVKQASEVYDACVKDRGRQCSKYYDLDYAGCQKDNTSCRSWN